MAARKTRVKKPKPTSDEPEKKGRPSEYTRAIGAEICSRLAEGESLRRMCKDDHLPHARTVRRWELGTGIPPEHHDAFRLHYAQARLSYQEAVHEELDDMARTTNVEEVPKARLWSDNTKWSLARMNRAKFGDRSELGLSGVDGQPPVTTSNVNVNLANLSPSDQEKLRELARQAITGADE